MIEKIRSDSIGPGQRFTVAAIEVSIRLRVRSNEVTVRWAPSHQGAPGNRKAGECAKIAADGGEPEDVELAKLWAGYRPIPHDKSGY